MKLPEGKEIVQPVFRSPDREQKTSGVGATSSRDHGATRTKGIVVEIGRRGERWGGQSDCEVGDENRRDWRTWVNWDARIGLPVARARAIIVWIERWGEYVKSAIGLQQMR